MATRMKTMMEKDNKNMQLNQIGTPAQKRVSAVLGLVSLATLATACGASSNSAPIVYGTEPAQGRIYNSPAEIYLDQQARVTPTTVQTNSAPVIAQQSQYQAAQSATATAPYAAQQGVRIYNRPPSAQAAPVIAQSQLPPVPTARQYDAYQSPATAEDFRRVEVGSNPQQSIQTTNPSYRGLPPAPTYLTGAPQTSVSSPTYVEPSYSAASSSGNSFVTVAPGETVYAISRRTGFSPKDIIAVNNLQAPYNLAIGQTLRMPGVVPVSAKTKTGAYADPYGTPVGQSISFDRVAAQPSPGQAQPLFREVIARDILYTVSPGDTLYSIARKYNVGVQAILSANRMNTQNLTIGQQLLLPAVPVNGADTSVPTQTRPVSSAPAYQPKPVARAVQQRRAKDNKNIESLTRQASYSKPSTASITNQFTWPVKGAVISNFGTSGVGRSNDGINIAAPLGTTVRAAANGEVVYRGSELDGYGNLLLVKHDGGFVTAYAHNDVMLVRKGQKVKKGQIIGKVGNTGSVNEPQLHFEIRQNLKSIDPMQFLASE